MKNLDLMEWVAGIILGLFVLLMFFIPPPETTSEWLHGNVWGAVAGGLAGLIGGRRDNRVRQQERRKANEFSYYMATHQHQHEVEDLRKAGLNPILSAGGGGSAAPMGQMAPIQSTAGPAAETALGVFRAMADQNFMKEQIKSMEVGRTLTEAQADQAVAAMEQLYSLANKLSAETAGLAFENANTEQRFKMYQEHEWLQQVKAVSDALGIKVSDITKMFEFLNVRGAFSALVKKFSSATQ